MNKSPFHRKHNSLLLKSFHDYQFQQHGLGSMGSCHSYVYWTGLIINIMMMVNKGDDDLYMIGAVCL